MGARCLPNETKISHRWRDRALLRSQAANLPLGLKMTSAFGLRDRCFEYNRRPM